jgi:hypothetical protein
VFFIRKDEGPFEIISREAGEDVDDTRMQQRRRRGPGQQVRITEEGMWDGEEFDDVWPARTPARTRPDQNVPDVRTEMRRRQVDAHQVAMQRYYATGNSFEPRATVPPHRKVTQTGIPAIQDNRRRYVYTDDMTSQSSGVRSRSRSKVRLHWLVFVGLAMFIMIIGWVAFNALESWWQVTQDDWHYGRPRTFQTDAVVGHKDSATTPSHFMAINLNRRILIIELPGGDSSKARIFNGPILIGQGQDLTPVRLSFRDVNGDGRPDMIVTVQDSYFVFLNDGSTFRMPPER